MNNSKRGGGLGVLGVLTIVFVVLKLLDVINWSWFWVLSPLWIDIIFIIALVIIIVLVEK